MCTHGCPWISMAVNSYPQMSALVRGYPLIVYGYPGVLFITTLRTTQFERISTRPAWMIHCAHDSNDAVVCFPLTVYMFSYSAAWYFAKNHEGPMICCHLVMGGVLLVRGEGWAGLRWAWVGQGMVCWTVSPMILNLPTCHREASARATLARCSPLTLSSTTQDQPKTADTSRSPMVCQTLG